MRTEVVRLEYFTDCLVMKVQGQLGICNKHRLQCYASVIHLTFLFFKETIISITFALLPSTKLALIRLNKD